MNNKTLEEDFKYCEKIISQNSKSFYKAFSSLPKERAKAIYAVYNFCRTVDDAVDLVEDPVESERALIDIEDKLNNVYIDKIPDEKGWRAFHKTIRQWNIDKQPFLDQIQGQKMDLNFKQFKDLDELLIYCDLVAGSVGRMLLPILSIPNAGKLKETASELGVAMQITNILRDIGEDLKERNRIYIPEDLMVKYKINKDDLLNLKVTDNFIKLWERMSAESEKRYSVYKDHLMDFDKECRLSLCLSVNLYSAINDEVRKENYDCLSKRNYLSKSDALIIVKRTKEELKILED